MKRAWPWLIPILIVAGLCWAFPPIHVHSLKAARDDQVGTPIDAKDFVAKFWQKDLLPATERATDAATLVKAIAADPKKVHEQFGRTVGMSSSYFLFVRGSGRVIKTDADSISLSTKPEGNDAEIVVPLGFVFGNAVRDGTGLLNSSNYPNAQEFNDLSSQLNDVVEKQVLPEAQRVATPGKRVKFAGCIEVADEEADLRPLKLVPIYVKEESARATP